MCLLRIWSRCFHLSLPASIHTHTSNSMYTNAKDYIQSQLPCVGRQLCHSVYWTLCQKKIPADEGRYSDLERKVNISDFLQWGCSAYSESQTTWMALVTASQTRDSHTWNHTALMHGKENPPWIKEMFRLKMSHIGQLFFFLKTHTNSPNNINIHAPTCIVIRSNVSIS